MIDYPLKKKLNNSRAALLKCLMRQVSVGYVFVGIGLMVDMNVLGMLGIKGYGRTCE